ncbi:MarR family winged helix-turn-helix transcriptional regulator [Microbacterium aquimaris]|uniref:MarR family winged helix-turn-helix transcriptional regulator n=1 Tax=Microbacterium aquimaris TaxID=459816 RepID=A0ABU5N341_9MICO|nr:MarR family winged helix-turn-helix transcriptional regulator [Microbacterium aquimaris]MDZ8160486.1 MarR family winged helix-turn-helix transcriptional regulator [Microbacterium aquimaris]
MEPDRPSPLFSVADLVLAVSRQLTQFDDRSGDITPLETTVLRHVDRHPGVSAGVAARATLLPPSNFSRAVRSLEAKGYVRREPDPADARTVRLHPTAKAAANLERLDATWSSLLGGILDDAEITRTIAALERIEASLAERGGASSDL